MVRFIDVEANRVLCRYVTEICDHSKMRQCCLRPEKQKRLIHIHTEQTRARWLAYVSRDSVTVVKGAVNWRKGGKGRGQASHLVASLCDFLRSIEAMCSGM